MNFMFEWQEQYLTRSLRSLVRYCSCHENIKFISSRHRVIFSIFFSGAISQRKFQIESFFSYQFAFSYHKNLCWTDSDIFPDLPGVRQSEMPDKATAIRPSPPPLPLKSSVKGWVQNLLLTKWGREVSRNPLQTHQQLRSQVLSP